MVASSKKFLSNLSEEDADLSPAIIAQLSSRFCMYSTINTFSIYCAAGYVFLQRLVLKGSLVGSLRYFKNSLRLKDKIEKIIGMECSVQEKLNQVQIITESELTKLRKKHLEIHILRVVSGKIVQETIPGDFPEKCYLLISTRIYILYYDENLPQEESMEYESKELGIVDEDLKENYETETIDSEEQSGVIEKERKTDRFVKYKMNDWHDIEKKLQSRKFHSDCECCII